MFKKVLSCLVALALVMATLSCVAIPASAESSVIYLSDAEGRALEQSMENGYQTVVYDKSIINGDIRLLDASGAEQIFEKGLGAHAPAKFVYNIEGQGFDRFISYVGVDRNVGDAGTVVFSVLADDVEVYNSGLMQGSDSYKTIDVDIVGAKTMTLLVDMYEHNAYDHADFAMARFVKLDETERIANAIAAIEQIGAVNILSSCEAKILAAERACSVVSDKSKITNYDLLLSARETYEALLAQAETNTIYLSDEAGRAYEQSMTNGHDVVRYDKSIVDGSLRLLNADGTEQIFEKGLGAHSPAEFIYNVEGAGLQYFISYIGVDRNVGDAGTVTFSVLVDGVEKYNSGLMRGSDAYKLAEVDISDAKIVTLVVGVYEHNANDHADFAMARFIKSNDESRAAKAIALIDAIGTVDVSRTSEAKILAAEAAYANVDDKTLVTNADLLAAARAEFDHLVASTPAEVIAVINWIEEACPITHRSVVPLKKAMAAYENLTAEQQEMVFNRDKMTEGWKEVQAMHDAFSVSVTGWPSALQSSCVTGWMADLSTEEQMRTKQAIADEIRRLYVEEGYKAGTTNGVVPVEAWAPTWSAAGILVNMGSSDSDNIGKIHDQVWGFGQIGTLISSPFAGMAFSQIRYMPQDFVSGGWVPFLSDTFLYNGRYYSMTWSAVKSYDSSIAEVRGKKLTSDELTYSYIYPGSGVTSDANNTFRYAYARYNQQGKADGKVLGIPSASAVLNDGVVYQLFEGPDGVAYIAGAEAAIAAAADTPSRPEGAYTITGKIAEAFMTLAESDAERFAVSGAPTGEMYEVGDNICQDFEKLTLAVNRTTGEVVQTSNDTSFENFAIVGGTVVSGLGSGINVVVPAGTDVTNLVASFEIHPCSTVTPAAGPMDFTNPVTYTVTSELGSTKEYVVTVIVDGAGSEADQQAAQAVIDAIAALPEEITLADAAQVQAAEALYEVLTPAQKYLVSNVAVLKAALDRLAVLNKGKIKVACIGDSITEGDLGGAGVNASTTYPTQLQELLGDRYEVKNFGKCGASLTRGSSYPYWNLSEFTASQEYQPDVVLIMIGVNDAWDGQWSNVKDRFESDYKDFVNVYKNLASQPIVYLTKVSGVNIAHHAVPEVNAIIERTANELNTQLADMYTWEYNLPEEDKKTLFPDGLHPNENGYRLMAKQFREQVFVPLQDSTLRSISVDGVALDDFDPAKTEYTIRLEKGAAMPVITAETTTGVARVEITQPTVFQPVAKLTVTAGNPYCVQNYILRVEMDEAADFTALDAALEAYGKLAEADYTSASWRVLQSLVDSAKALDRDAMTAADQSEIDALAADIQAAIAALAPVSIEMRIAISAGMVVPQDNGKYSITWNAQITVGDDTSLDAINASGLKITRYGAYYAASEEDLAGYMDAANADKFRDVVFDEGEDLTVCTRYGFRLKNVAADRTRCAMFYLEYTYEGHTYIVLSSVDKVIVISE